LIVSGILRGFAEYYSSLAGVGIINDIRRVTALEIIEQIKQLPPVEKGKVAEFVRADTVRYAKDEDALRAAEAVFTEHPELFRQLAR